MRMIRLNCFLVILAFFAFNLYGQDEPEKDLPADPKEFINKVEGKFQKLQSEEAESALETFIANWESGKFTKEEMGSIMKVEAFMDQNRYRPSKGYQTYLQALNAAKANELGGGAFQQWHKTLLNLVKDQRSQFVSLNESLKSYYSKEAIYSSRTKNWYVRDGALDIEYDKTAYFTFDNITLTCVGQKDTIKVTNTSGKMDVQKGTWEGKGGQVTWEKVGLSPQSVFAELSDYEVKLRKGALEADSVKFHNKNFMNETLKGSLKDQLSSLSGNRAKYPQFNSYQASYNIDDLFGNLNYRGGFAMEGRQVEGTGTDQKRAAIKLTQQGEKQFLAKSKKFTIDPEGIVSKRANATIYFQGDSLYHSNVGIQYIDSTKEITLRRGDGLGQSPFKSSFHQLEIIVDYIDWNIEESTLSMRMKRNSPDAAEFQSTNFFNQGHYHKMKSILTYHPLNKLKDYAERDNSKTFSDKAYANFIDGPLDNIKRVLIRLSKEGFIQYDIEVGKVKILPKLIHYVQADRDLTDYDNIVLESVIERKDNAKLDLNTGNLKIEGVGQASLSDSSRVQIFPKEQKITVKENLNAEFDGQMIAGRFHYYGEDYFFNYDSFKMKLNNIDSLRIYFPDEKTGRIKAVDHVIEEISGSVAINHPNNKSGKVQMDEYPIFDCTDNAIVHYEKSYIYDKVYQRDTFYFELEPFTVDSLKTFTKQGIQFDGTFYSANIFPTFDHQLTLMDDLSLGFQTRTPPDGYPMYGGKGKGIMEITLNKQGLKGAGKIDYLASTTESREFLLFPDSTKAITESFTITEKGQDKYPPVSAGKVFNHWQPYKDSMNITEREPIIVYNEDFEFEGDLILTPKELYGSGKFNYEQAEIASDALAFEPTQISSDTASFKMKSPKEGKPAIYAPNVNFNLNLSTQMFKGSSNFKDTLTDFDYHQYQTSIQQFTWDVKGKTVALKTGEDQTLDEAFLESTSKEQDSLKFNSTAALFDLEKYTIEAKNIPHINLADAQAYPSDGEVLIKENSELKTLTDATIKVDTNYFFHEFLNANINIKSQSKYYATGDYFYKDRNGDEHKIYFQNIRVDEYGQTIGEATISDTSDFPISPKFKFAGKVRLQAQNKELVFDGKIKPSELPIDMMGTQGLSFQKRIYPDSIYIPYDQAAEEDKLQSGLLLDQQTKEIYPSFLGKKHNPADKALFEASGYLTYNYDQHQYVITKDSFSHMDSGKVHKLVYNSDQLKLTTKGPINLHFDNDKVDLRSAGIMEYRLHDSTHAIDLTMGLDFPFSNNALQIVADSINKLAFYQSKSNDKRDAGIIGISHLIKNPEVRQKIVDELKSFGALIANEDYQPNFLLSDVQLQWNPERKAFINDGTLGLGTILNKEINKEIDGYISLEILRNKELKFMVKGSEGNFYYFNFTDKNNKMEYEASDPFFSDALQEEFEDLNDDDDYEVTPLKNNNERLIFEGSFKDSQN